MTPREKISADRLILGRKKNRDEDKVKNGAEKLRRGGELVLHDGFRTQIVPSGTEIEGDDVIRYQNMQKTRRNWVGESTVADKSTLTFRNRPKSQSLT
jgi:hypothetical protein